MPTLFGADSSRSSGLDLPRYFPQAGEPFRSYSVSSLVLDISLCFSPNVIFIQDSQNWNLPLQLSAQCFPRLSHGTRLWSIQNHPECGIDEVDLCWGSCLYQCVLLPSLERLLGTLMFSYPPAQAGANNARRFGTLAAHPSPFAFQKVLPAAPPCRLVS